MNDKRITLKLGSDVMARARRMADRSGKSLEDILAEWLDRYASDLPVETLSDEDVLHLCELEMNFIERQELTVLLAHHRVRDLEEEERTRLDELIHLHRRVLVRKARALRVAYERGLRTNGKH